MTARQGGKGAQVVALPASLTHARPAEPVPPPPMPAQVAEQQGRYLAEVLNQEAANLVPNHQPQPFKYRHLVGDAFWGERGLRQAGSLVLAITIYQSKGCHSAPMQYACTRSTTAVPST